MSRLCFPSAVPPFAGCAPWLLAGSLWLRFATLRSLLRAHYDCLPPSPALCSSLARAYCCCDVGLCSRCGASPLFRAWTLVCRCRPSFRRWFAAERASPPKFTGIPAHAPLPCSRTPVARASLAFDRDACAGPRRVKGEDRPQGETFEAQWHGFGARCQRFVPASRRTTHDSLPAAWLQALPGGVLTRWVAA